MIKAVIFDMDGTMVDTEGLWRDVSTKLSERYGVVFTEELRKQMMGRKDYEALRVFKEYFKLDVPVEELSRIRRAMLEDDIRLITVKEGLYDLLDLIDSRSMKKAVATSSYPRFVQKIFSSLNLDSRFSVIVSGDDVTLSKPAPDIFLEAARRLGVPPAESLVIEDAQIGVEAAYRAGMKVIAIPHIHSAHHDFTKADHILNSFGDITPNFLATL